MNIKERLNKGLAKTKGGFVGNIQSMMGMGRKVDQDLLDELEELLISADVGVQTSEEIIEQLDEQTRSNKIKTMDDVLSVLKEQLAAILDQAQKATPRTIAKPFVISVVGVNGTGKTTTIGKLANVFRQQNKSVMMAAADTFRAAAIEQLAVWGERTNTPVVQPQPGADPASVAFDAYKSAVSKDVDILIIDTAGRLHTNVNLMAELDKIHRVVKQQNPDAPHEVLLVMDATTGQNGLSQARQFTLSVPVTGIVLTKLDGTARGGILFSIVRELGIPVKYIGLGEQLEDLQPFDSAVFVEALFK